MIVIMIMVMIIPSLFPSRKTVIQLQGLIRVSAVLQDMAGLSSNGRQTGHPSCISPSEGIFFATSSEAHPLQ